MKTKNNIKLGEIELLPTNERWHLESLNYDMEIFVVVSETKRSQFKNIIGKKYKGRKIKGVESFCIENQRGMKISLAFLGGTEKEKK